MKVRMESFEIPEWQRRAIRWATDGRRTMCTRKEAQAWIDGIIAKATADLDYRFRGPKVDEATANGADPAGLASRARQVPVVEQAEESVAV